MTPTIEQNNIINANGNIVTVARPGSGKTFVLAEKIKKILPDLKDYEGIIAISFTNKASKELKDRALTNGIDKKESFFGTIHKFYISEIVLSFGKQLFGLPENDLEIVNIEQSGVDEGRKEFLDELVNNFNYTNQSHIDELKEIFSSGQIYLELIEKFAIYIFDNSVACRRYLQTKYQYIIIDEFQDCGIEQYTIFIKLQQLGLIAIAVGDLDQSIYGFTGKSSTYLQELLQNENFTTYALTRNHRCHPSIINYSLRLMSQHSELLPTNDDIRVYHRNIIGNERNLLSWIDDNISEIMENFEVSSLSEVAILVKNHRTEEIVDNNLRTPHKVVKQSFLEADSNEVSLLFDNVLKFIFDTSNTITEIIELFVSLETLSSNEQKKLHDSFVYLKKYFSEGNSAFDDVKDKFEAIASILIPLKNRELSLNILEQVLLNQLDIYSSRNENEIQILTLHKSKGLEFEVVFHFDLYEWILPAKRPINRHTEFIDYAQDLNLHYVGITRAKNACILCTTSTRTNYLGESKRGNISEFLNINNLSNLRR